MASGSDSEVIAIEKSGSLRPLSTCGPVDTSMVDASARVRLSPRHCNAFTVETSCSETSLEPADGAVQQAASGEDDSEVFEQQSAPRADVTGAKNVASRDSQPSWLGEESGTGFSCRAASTT